MLYLSEAPETALIESNEHARRNNLPLWEWMPKVIVAVAVDARAVIDLMDQTVRATLPLPWGQFMDDWRAMNRSGVESPSQALGRAAFAAGLDGLRVPSKPDSSGVNLVIFRRAHGGSASVTLMNAEILKSLGTNRR